MAVHQGVGESGCRSAGVSRWNVSALNGRQTKKFSVIVSVWIMPRTKITEDSKMMFVSRRPPLLADLGRPDDSFSFPAGAEAPSEVCRMRMVHFLDTEHSRV